MAGFVQNAEALKAKGVDTIACTAANDVFVMNAWGKDQGCGDKVMMLADGSADFAKALGLELDLTGRVALGCLRNEALDAPVHMRRRNNVPQGFQSD